MKNRFLPVLKQMMAISDKFFLMYGTLLGCIRDGEFIEWDDDMDIGILEEDWNDDFIAELSKFAQVSVSKHNNRTSKIRLVHDHDHTCLNIMRDENGDRFFTEGNITLTVPGKYLKEFKEIDFYDMKVRVPVNAEEFLAWDYGDWKTPQKEYNWTSKPGLIK